MDLIKEVTEFEFSRQICEDYGIEYLQKFKIKFENFPIVKGQRKIKFFHNGTIVDRQGIEHPYMLNNFTRNNDKLQDFDYLYKMTGKSLNQIIEETGVELKSKPCKICEGNGWYSHGVEYTYKNIKCQI